MASFKERRFPFFSLLPLLTLVLFAFYLSLRGGSLGPVSRLYGLADGTFAGPSSPVALQAQQGAPVSTLVSHGLARRQADDDDPYTCGPGRPCSNGACCGSTGNCGYAPAYCGAGCQSNCDAKAECGQYAADPGQTCKLNACCSEHGFCGTTKDFCKDGCQSNCILDPKPPGPSAQGTALDRVIGYYESWAYKSDCNQKSPSDLPLKELTHLNYAFVFIDPDTYELVTMDMEQEDELWHITVDSKQYNPSLKVYVAVGGWTFSDNGTVTQPLFGEIARTEANRQQFADGVVKFLNKYGFDGLDIDWEYPGAGDRGGKDEDIPNFVLLMKTLRSTFDASPRHLGLTFTIPSSFWYLRWFDMPGLLEYADWTNLMSYDLHGTWDGNNPIGAIAQAHTNLTEIKLATQLLWRVGVRPDQVVLGYGFYGRAFELADPSCTTPGCPFSGGAKKGPCSDEAGILMYYEIQAILKKYPDLEPVFDKEAAVKYFTWDKNQWISYDDVESFELKLEWAHETGFGGAMIWAVDTDDDKYTAMSGLLGYQVSHVDTSVVQSLAMSDSNVAETLKLENGEGCQIMKDYDCAPYEDMSCPYGQDMVGYDRNGCGSEDDDDYKGVPVCCPTGSTSEECIWRGTPEDGGIWGDCNGQCHAGETKIGDSKWGGSESADEEWPLKKCNRGKKVLCCPAVDWKNVIDGCYWTSCMSETQCSKDTTEVATKKGSCPMSVEQKYCCPWDTGLYECKWRGSAPDCVDANCKTSDDGKDLFEVQVDAHAGGGSWNLCTHGRKKALCCQVRVTIPEPLTCPSTTCDFDPDSCNPEDFDQWDDSFEEDELGLIARDLEKRGGPRPFKTLTVAGALMRLNSLSYPTPRGFMRGLNRGLIRVARAWVMQSEDCGNPRLQGVPIERSEGPPADTQVEHALPLLIIPRFTAVAQHGRMWAPSAGGSINDTTLATTGQVIPRGPLTETPAVGNEEFWQNVWNNANGLPAGLPRVTENSTDIRWPVQRLFEALGSNTNPRHFILLQRSVNSAKGRVENFKAPKGKEEFERLLEAATNPSSGEATMSDVNAMLNPLRDLRAMFSYLAEDDVISAIDASASAVYFQLQLMELHNVDAQGLSSHWSDFYPAYFRLVSEFARTWAQNRIREIRDAYDANPDAPYREEVLTHLTDIEDDIPNWTYPSD